MADLDTTSDVTPVAPEVRTWLDAIVKAKRREKDWRRDGRDALKIYDSQKREVTPFNILYSNTETLLPALYNAQPRPVVQRRFKDEDPVGKMSADAGKRVLEYSVDTNSEEYAPFDEVMVDAVLDGLVPGRGAVRVKYDAKINSVPAQQEGGQPTEVLEWELVCYQSTKWDRLIIGFAHKWKDVPWIAYEHDVTKEEATKLFGAEKAEKLQYSVPDKDKEDGEDKDSSGQDDESDQKVARVYEVWDRVGGKRIIFVSPQFVEGFLKVDADPLDLTGFYPTPEPLRFLRKANDQMPTTLYTLYENQAKELNRITVRINKIVEALKVRGAYDSQLGADIANILAADDNKLIPADNVAALQQTQGLEKAIWLMPLEKLVLVLQQLIVARQQCKQVIYEITGISDILRGQSVASETATAQQIKNQWGTLRLKRLQREVQRYARDLLRITLEIAAKKFSERTWAAMTGLPFPTTEQKVQLQQQMMIAQQQPQGSVNPQAMVAMAQAMRQPGWGDILKVLRDDTQRQYRIDIETNSTVDVEATEDQKIMSEVLTAMSQFIQGVSPLVISGTMPFQVAQSMLLAIVRRYRFGPEIEDHIKAMQPPKPPDDGKKQAAAMKMKQDQENHDHDMKMKQADFNQNQVRMAQEAELAREEHQFKMAEMRRKAQLAELQGRVKIAVLQAQAAAASAKASKGGDHAAA